MGTSLNGSDLPSATRKRDPEHQQKFRFGNSKGSVGTLSLGSGPQLTLSEKTRIRDYRK